MPTATTGASAPTASLLSESDSIAKRELEIIAPSLKAGRALVDNLTMYRALSWGENALLGVQQNLLAAAWGVTPSQASHPTTGVVAGQFLSRVGASAEISRMSVEAMTELESLGIRPVSSFVVRWRLGDKPMPQDWMPKFRSIAKRDKANDVDDKLVKSWLETARTLGELEAMHAAHLKMVAAREQETPNQKAAAAALALVQGKPSAELLAQCKRVVALSRTPKPTEDKPTE